MKKYILSLSLLFALAIGLLPSRAVLASTADDEFNSMSLDAKWTWTRENVGSWSLTGTALQMTTLNEEMFESTQSAPLLLQDLVDDFGANNKYQVITRVTITPSAYFHQAGIVIYQDDGNFIQLNVQYWDQVEVEIYREQANDGIAYYKATTGFSGGAILLKLERYENIYTGWYSLDEGASWQIVGQFRDVSIGPTKFGLTAYHASATTGTTATFDYFRAELLDPVLGAPANFQGWWKCTVATGQTCPTQYMGGLSAYTYTGENTVTNSTGVMEVQLICRHDGCSRHRDIRFVMDWDYSWTSGYSSAGAQAYSEVSTLGSHSGTAVYGNEEHKYCGIGKSGDCSGMSGGVIPKMDMDDRVIPHLRFSIMDSGVPSVSSTTKHRWYTITIGFLNVIEANCSDSFLILTEETGLNIDPTVELPADTSEQYQETVVGTTYRITTTGGPWNDSLFNRYDAAISWDGTTYTPIDELEDILCVEFDAENPELVSFYIVAPTTTFYIRANDLAGYFADNTVTLPGFFYNFAVAIGTGPIGCEEYSYDPVNDLIADGTIDATLEDGIDSGGEFVPYMYYMIETTDGPWLDGGTGGDRYDGQASWTSTDYEAGQSFTFGAEGDAFGVGCTEEAEDGIHSRTYFQAPGTQFGPDVLALQLRVNDTGGVFSDNTGDLGYKIYAVDYTPGEQLCEQQYVIGDVITSGQIMANADEGKYVGAWYGDPLGYHVPAPNMEPGAAYMIETSGGPWNFLGVGHSGTSSYDVALSGETSGQVSGWDTPETWDFADCVVDIDAIGHKRIYFTALPDVYLDLNQEFFETFIRVGDTADFGSNNGSMRFTLYGVTDMKDEDESCIGYSYEVVDPALSEAIVQGNDADGVYISNVNMIDPEMTFVIVVDEGAWQEYSGGEDLYTMQISNDGGATWQDFPQADFRHCYDDEGSGRLALYVPGGAYDVRVDSATFSDNTGYRHVSVYSVGNQQDCFGQYDPYIIDPFEWIPEDREEGIVITGQEGLPTTNLVVGQTYILEILEGPWTTPSTQSYDAALSSDNGVTWYPMESHPDVICFGTDYLKFHDKVVFTVATEQNWKVRVNDSAGQFGDNGGNLAYSLSTTLSDVVDPGDAWDQYVQDCDNACLRPTSIDVAEWIDYAGCRVQQYFAWCPDNTDTILAFTESLKTLEPFGTITESTSLISSTQTEIDSYDWSGSEFGEEGALGVEGGADINKLIPTLPSNSPWLGGPVVTWSWSNPSNLYSTSCSSVLVEYIGPYAGGGVCWVTNIADESSLLYWVQIIIDLSAAMMLFSYLMNMLADAAKWLSLS